MNTQTTASIPTWIHSAVAREDMLADRGEPLFLADWERTLMLHYEVEPEMLQPFVPFELDTWKGKAYVSLVAFTMRGLAPRLGGKVAARLFQPVATHEFLNVRTYVKHQGESGIYFLAEWLPNKLSILMGRPIFGLPYRPGKHAYRHDHENGVISGSVHAVGQPGALRYKSVVAPKFVPCTAGSLTEFLMERYTAFTFWMGWKRRFRVWHPPWLQVPVNVDVIDDTLLTLTGDWASHARFIGANYSPGMTSVWMGRPHFLYN